LLRASLGAQESKENKTAAKKNTEKEGDRKKKIE